MAARPMQNKTKKITKLFKTMSYEVKEADQQLFKQWKSSNESLNELPISIKPPSTSDADPSERTRLMQKFACLIETSKELFCQIGANINIRKEDTKKAVQLLIDYIRFYAACTLVLDEKRSKGHILCIFNTYPHPGLLGSVLGPVLALGSTIVITTNNELDHCVLLSQLAITAGYPKGTITVVNVKNSAYTCLAKMNQWHRVIYFGCDILTDRILKMHNTCFLSIENGKIPMIVFDSADQQAACEVLIDAVWAYNGNLPWSVDTVFVQENIWDNFLTLLKRSINQHSLDFNSQKFDSAKINKMILDAQKFGIEIYQGGTDANLVVFIGQRVYETNVINANNNVGLTLTVLPFRTINEGVALANNNRQGLAASIWGETISQVSEAAKKLQVGTVWINSYGVFRPDVSFMPWKESGFGHFGGLNGLYEHQVTKRTNIKLAETSSDLTKIKSLYTVSAASQISWEKIGYANRLQSLLKLITVFKQKSNFEDWVTAIYNGISSIQNMTNSIDFNDLSEFNLQSSREPFGVIVIEDTTCAKGKEILFTALLAGNTVFLINENMDNVESILIEHFPKGVFSFISNISEASELADEQNIMFIINMSEIYSTYVEKFKHIEDKSAHLYTTKTKNIWTSIGQTYC